MVSKAEADHARRVEQARLDEEEITRQFMVKERDWPTWPRLPLKNRKERDPKYPGMPMMGCMVEGHDFTVFLGTIFEDLTKVEVREYRTAQEAISAGWVVD